MRAFVLFAAFSLSGALLRGAPASLVEVREPAGIAAVFPSRAALRVVNVWATWCVPCVEEMSDLRAIDSTFGSEVSIVGVSLDDMIPADRSVTKQKVITFLDGNHIRFPNVYYRGSSDALADYLRFGGEIPITIIFDRKGRELWRQQGKLDRQKTIAEIRKLLRRHQ